MARARRGRVRIAHRTTKGRMRRRGGCAAHRAHGRCAPWLPRLQQHARALALDRSEVGRAELASHAHGESLPARLLKAFRLELGVDALGSCAQRGGLLRVRRRLVRRLASPQARRGEHGPARALAALPRCGAFVSGKRRTAQPLGALAIALMLCDGRQTLVRLRRRGAVRGRAGREREGRDGELRGEMLERGIRSA